MLDSSVHAGRPESPATRSPGKLACLDGLRGLAILLVILFHFTQAGPRSYHPAISAILSPFRYGFSGVHLFLVLSGFCLTHSLIGREAARRPPSLGSYLVARWRRIAPPYYVAMAIYLAIPAAYLLRGRQTPLTESLSAWQVATHLLFVHGFWPETITAINTPFWSLSLEFQFYMAFPLLFVLARRVGVVAMIAAVVAASLAWRALLAGLLADPGHLIDGVFVGRWSEFAFGMAVAFLFNAGERGRLAKFPWATIASLALALGVVLSARTRTFAANLAFGVGYASLLAAVLLSSEGRGALGRVASTRLLVAIGVASYSLYLSHTFFQERGTQVYALLIPRPNLATDLAALAAMTAAIGVGGFGFHRLVERRFLAKAPAPRRLTQAASATVAREEVTLASPSST